MRNTESREGRYRLLHLYPNYEAAIDPLNCFYGGWNVANWSFIEKQLSLITDVEQHEGKEKKSR